MPPRQVEGGVSLGLKAVVDDRSVDSRIVLEFGSLPTGGEEERRADDGKCDSESLAILLDVLHALTSSSGELLNAGHGAAEHPFESRDEAVGSNVGCVVWKRERTAAVHFDLPLMDLFFV